MIPPTRSTFGPMAVAIMGGLIVATLLTLLFVPALYAAWYRVRAGGGALRGTIFCGGPSTLESESFCRQYRHADL